MRSFRSPSAWLALATMLLCALSAALPALAADTDIFASNAPVGENAPHLLYVIDTGASFSASNNSFRCNIDSSGTIRTDGTGAAADFTALDKSNGGVEQCALYSVIKSLASGTQTVRVGIMLFNGNQVRYDASTDTFGSACPGSGGGCLVLPFTAINSLTAPNVLKYIRGWTTSGSGNYNIKSPANRGDGATMQEAWAYFYGKTGISGQSYAGTAPSSACASRNILFVGNAFDTQASPKDTTNTTLSPKDALLGALTMASTKRADPVASDRVKGSFADTYSGMACGTTTKSGTVPTDEGSGGYAINWTAYLKEQGVSTYAVGVTGNNCDSTYVASMIKMGSSEVGGAKFFNTTNFDELVKALKTVFSEIKAVNSAFASAALPASVNTQGLYLNQVFIGMFRPAANFLPRWNGNLKHYKMGLVNNDLQLQDADGDDAINTSTGFVTECARSFWTDPAPDTYWSFAAGISSIMGFCGETGATVSNSPDGNIVEKGAQAYRLRAIAPADRVVKTCGTTMATCTNTLIDFSTTGLGSLSATTFGAASDAERNALINFARGQNVDDESNLGTGVMRATAHGDVVHSRPVAVNHGTEALPSVVVYYGGNDGMLRAVNGNRTATITSGGTTYTAGQEMWAFMPPEYYGRIKRQRLNTDGVAYPGSGYTNAKDYGMDGPLTAFQGTIGGVAKTYVYGTMRRGGRSIYAFDVSTPGTPALLWKKGCVSLSADTDCSSEDMKAVGQTWSSLKTMYAAGYGSGASPLLVTGGGYDDCEDSDAGTTTGRNHSCVSGGGTVEPTGVTKGNRVYVLDAANGNVVASFKTKRAVVADITLVKDSTGNTILGYTADLGGNVYRISFAGLTSASWTMTQVASLGCATPASCTDSVANRKFMFAPSVISLGSNQYALSLGSGDREKPVSSYVSARNVTNYFFKIVDDVGTVSGATWLSGESGNCGGASVICLASLLGITTAATPTDAQVSAKPKGWYLGMTSTEQVVTSAITVFGVVTFSSHQPVTTSTSTCSVNLGTTRVYNVSYKNAQGVVNGALVATRSALVSGGGLPPSPIAGLVRLDDQSIQPFCIGCSAESPEKPKKPVGFSNTATPKGRLYWYIQK